MQREPRPHQRQGESDLRPDGNARRRPARPSVAPFRRQAPACVRGACDACACAHMCAGTLCESGEPGPGLRRRSRHASDGVAVGLSDASLASKRDLSPTSVKLAKCQGHCDERAHLVEVGPVNAQWHTHAVCLNSS